MGLPRGRTLGRLLRAASLSSGHGRLPRGFEDLESLGGLLGGGALLGILVGSQEGLGSREAFGLSRGKKGVERHERIQLAAGGRLAAWPLAALTCNAKMLL